MTRLALSALVIVAGLLAPTPAAAQANGAAAAAPADTRLRTVVMGLSARRGVEDKDLVHAMSDVVLGVYSRDARRIVIGPEDIRRALDWEASRQQAGCDDSKCLSEVGAALDARRIVAGVLDSVGGMYMVTLSEIDAVTLEPVARAQDEVEKDEGKLLAAVRRLTSELLESASKHSGATQAAAFTGNSGSVEFTSDPRGAQIFVGSNAVGATPTRLDNIAPGRHAVRLVRTDYETVELTVPVYPGGTTKVLAELKLQREIAEQNLAVRRARYKEDEGWHAAGAWTKAIAGGVVGAGGGLLMLGGLATGNGSNTLTGAVVGGAGGAVLAWGMLDFANPPPAPVPEWELERRVLVTPPPELGEAEVTVLQAAPQSGTSQNR
jgi:hypothetical protein